MGKETLSHLEVMDQMVKDNNQGIRMSNNMQEVKLVAQGTIISFGVENNLYDDAKLQLMTGASGNNMLIMFAVNRDEFEKTKLKLQDSMQKKFFIRQFYNTIPKNKLDITLRAAFKVFEDKIITEAQLKQFPELHKKATEAYYASGGKCKPIGYESTYTGHFTPSSSRKNANIYVTTGYWLEVIEVKEG